MIKSNFKIIFLVFTLSVTTLLEAAIIVSADRNPVYLNESFQLIFESEESPDDDPDFSSLQQFFVVLNTNRSSNISIINGEYKRKFSWAVQLMPKQAGNIVIPSIHFGSDSTKPVVISVKPASQSSAGNQKGLIFEMVADKTSVYVQQQFIVTQRLMSDTNIARYEMPELKIENMDVVIEPLGEETQYQTRIADVPYLVIEKKYAVFPQQSGNIKLEPAVAEAQLRSRSRSAFDPFQNNGEIRRAESSSLVLEVLPPAAQFSGTHWLPTTDLQISDAWQGDLDKLVAGEPVTRTISLLAHGLTASQLPELSQQTVTDIKLYPDKAESENRLSDTGIVALRQQKIALIPSSGGGFTLPEIVIPWWNVETDKQEYARIPERTINVEAPVVAEPVTPSASANSQTAQSLAVQPVLADTETSSVTSFWMWLSLVLAMGWLTSAVIWWYRKQQQKTEVSWNQLRNQRGLRRARKRLQQACNNQQAHEARDALLVWANALETGQQFQNLDQVDRYFFEPLSGQIKRLNQSLYSAASGDWDGGELFACCQRIEADFKREVEAGGESELVAFNP